jgi:thioesterase domain-containing protein/acyl carrier protein
VGEELLFSDVQRFHQNTGANIYNQYGPTESIGLISVDHCSPYEEMVTLGRPILNIRLYILNAQLQPVPLGCYGELYIAKRYLAKGYLGQEELTAQRFIPNPFIRPEELALGHYTRLYKSGDKVRWLPDGRLQFAGRIDFQVKINGKRVELGEIEAVIASHKMVQATAVIKLSDRLVAFVALNHGVSINALRTYATEYLPSFMIPSQWIIVSALPVTQTGKIDRKLLPSLVNSNDLNRTEVTSFHSAPENFSYLYEHISTAVEKLLPTNAQRQALDPHQSFFELGMDSLSLIKFSQILKKQLGINFSIQSLFIYQTLSTLTQHIFILLQENKSTLFQITKESFLIPLREKGSQSPLFMIPGGAGEENEILPFMLMLTHCTLDRPIYGIRSRASDAQWKIPKTLNEQAQAVFKEIKKIQPDGPYYFLGECFASTMALELTKIAEQTGEPGIIMLLDNRPLFRETFFYSRYVNQFSPRYIEKVKRKRRHKALKLSPNLGKYYHLLTLWKPTRFKSQLHLILSSDMKKPNKFLKQWKPFFNKTPCLHVVAGNHITYVRQQSAETVGIINDVFN